jgi:hypothetical protein
MLHGALPRPGKCACRRTTGPAPSVAGGRRNCAAGVHSCHMPFFSPPHQHHDSRLRVAEHATHCCLRAQPGKTVRVLQPSLFAHRRIMPSFPFRSKRSNRSPVRLPGTKLPFLYPLDSPKTRFYNAQSGQNPPTRFPDDRLFEYVASWHFGASSNGRFISASGTSCRRMRSEKNHFSWISFLPSLLQRVPPVQRPQCWLGRTFLLLYEAP